MKNNKDWLIWSNRNKMWWASDHKGYARLLKNAGRYSFEEAVAVCKRINDNNYDPVPSETMVRFDSFDLDKINYEKNN